MKHLCVAPIIEGHGEVEAVGILLATACRVRGDLDLACVMARREYEAWFIAAADSLTRFLSLRVGDDSACAAPDEHGEKWISDRFRGVSYQKTVDQAKLTAAMDLTLGRARSPSFDKLCRELQRRANTSG